MIDDHVNPGMRKFLNRHSSCVSDLYVRAGDAYTPTIHYSSDHDPAGIKSKTNTWINNKNFYIYSLSKGHTHRECHYD